MELKDEKNPLYEGNIYWLYECFKNESQDFAFDKPYTDKKQLIETEYLLYECLMFNEDREDSLFVMQDGQLYEYFSTDKSELLLKLIQYYENRLKNNFSKSLIEDSLPEPKEGTPMYIPIESEEDFSLSWKFKKTDKNFENENDGGIRRKKVVVDFAKRFKFNERNKDPEIAFKSTIKANILLEYKDGSTHWEYNYELKKILFYMKFLKRSSEIKIIRIFPLSVKKIEPIEISWIDSADQFIEGKEAKLSKDKINVKLDNLVKKLKTLFYDKYLLNLKKMTLYVFELDNREYIYNVKDFIFEKYENKHVKLSAEGLFHRYKEKYKDKTKLEKDPNTLGAIESFYKAMMGKYHELFDSVVDKSYLEKPERDPTSDQAYKILKPESPYSLSTLMEPKVGIKTFVKYATYNLWNQDDRVGEDDQ